MEKTPRDIILQMCTKDDDQMMFLRYGAKKTDGWRDEQKK